MVVMSQKDKKQNESPKNKNEDNKSQVAINIPDGDEVGKINTNDDEQPIIKNFQQTQDAVESVPLIVTDSPAESNPLIVQEVPIATVVPLVNVETPSNVENSLNKGQEEDTQLKRSHTESEANLLSELGAKELSDTKVRVKY